MLLKSRKMYKEGKYYTRIPVKSFKSTPSKHISEALEKIVKKGEGAYYSSGSRPNQTAQS